MSETQEMKRHCYRCLSDKDVLVMNGINTCKECLYIKILLKEIGSSTNINDPAHIWNSKKLEKCWNSDSNFFCCRDIQGNKYKFKEAIYTNDADLLIKELDKRLKNM